MNDPTDTPAKPAAKVYKRADKVKAAMANLKSGNAEGAGGAKQLTGLSSEIDGGQPSETGGLPLGAKSPFSRFSRSSAGVDKGELQPAVVDPVPARAPAPTPETTEQPSFSPPFDSDPVREGKTSTTQHTEIERSPVGEPRLSTTSTTNSPGNSSPVSAAPAVGKPKSSPFSRFAVKQTISGMGSGAPPSSKAMSSESLLAYQEKFVKAAAPFALDGDALSFEQNLGSPDTIQVDWPWNNPDPHAFDNAPAWTDGSTPAGSLYSPEEWGQAEAGGQFVVFESRNQGQSALVQIKAPPPLPKEPKAKPPGWIAPTVVVPPDALDHFSASFFDRVLLIQTGANNRFSHEVTGKLFVEWSMGVIGYDVIRPADRLSEAPHLKGVVWRQPASQTQLRAEYAQMFSAETLHQSVQADQESIVNAESGQSDETESERPRP